ncbi:MGMT family protein [Arsenicibacter rosenii]|uniref:Cysteine methyltransferase n=1 Tax=Arsenicibacter rosenii TaxID=1750698 RepID=A0A1S2VLM7_9BACT|nr:MGMT family protein [Arsenicibacter rosenii]OIN59662.1 cysteine methyltransferase [Arsenicibacter rosenii]
MSTTQKLRKGLLPVKPMRDYFQDVYDVVRQIPAGRVTTYGAIARYLSLRAGARMVGWAMNGSHTQPDIPAHRVVNRLGILSGKHFFGSPTAMQERLEAEGIRVENDQIVDFTSVLWDPASELTV